MVAARGNNTNPARIPALGLRVLVFVFASIVLMYVDHREHHLDTVRQTIGAAVYPLQLVVDNRPVLPFWERAPSFGAGRESPAVKPRRLK